MDDENPNDDRQMLMPEEDVFGLNFIESQKPYYFDCFNLAFKFKFYRIIK